MNIPNDPMMLVSYLNTQLRDFYPSLEELCKSLDLDQQQICDKLKTVDYSYDAATNRFIRRIDDIRKVLFCLFGYSARL